MPHIAAIATAVILSNSVSNMADLPQAKQSIEQLHLAHSAIGPCKTVDGAKSVDILNEAKKALQIDERRNQMKPGFDERVVEKMKKKRDKVLIMGGAEAFPM